MCGIFGIVAFAGTAVDLSAFDAMGRLLDHRGPDGTTTWTDQNAALGVKLLRIIDPATSETQPFTDPRGDTILICNGEVYNADELRARYHSYPYRTSSDIEPLIPLYLDRGLDAFAEIDGMYAMAILERRSRRLTLARDRAGEKPLFHTRIGDTWLFASEIQSLLEHPRVSRDLDRRALSQVTTLGYTLQPLTPFTAIQKVRAGTALRVCPNGSADSCFWNPEKVERRPRGTADELGTLLRSAVGKQLVSDVPVGIFTSGGLDSSLLLALSSQHRRPQDIHAFTVGFPEKSFDERRWAGEIAKHLGTQHESIVADAAAMGESVRIATRTVAEPITDPAFHPTVILARAAKQHVGVVLSGEGADELLGGYPTYLGHHLAYRFAALPGFMRRVLSGAARAMPKTRRKVPLEYLAKQFVSFSHLDPFSRHLSWFGTGAHPERAIEEARDRWTESEHINDALTRLAILDYGTYLREGLLTKIDRATMLSSLEARAPFLDPDVTSFALSLPPKDRVRGFETKPLLKKVAARYLPRRFVSRRKRGLSVPIDNLMRGDLSAEFQRLLIRRGVAELDLLPAARVGELVSQHFEGHANHARALWALLVTGLWVEHWSGA